MTNRRFLCFNNAPKTPKIGRHKGYMDVDKYGPVRFIIKHESDDDYGATIILSPKDAARLAKFLRAKK